MGIPYKETTFTDGVNIGTDENGNLIEVTGYEWGSNSFVVNNAIVMAYAYDINGTSSDVTETASLMLLVTVHTTRTILTTDSGHTSLTAHSRMLLQA